MKNSKRGVTLTELIICCAIIVLVSGACTSVLMSGHKIFNNSANSANAQLETDVLQTYLTNMIPRAPAIRQLTDIEEVDALNANVKDCIYIDENGTFFIRVDGKDVEISAIVDFEYMLKPAGKNVNRRRPQFVYKVTLQDGTSYTSGFVIGNLIYDFAVGQAGSDYTSFQSVSDRPVCFTPASATE